MTKRPAIDASWYRRPREKLPQRTSAGGVVLRRQGRRWLVAMAREGDYPEYVLPKGGVDPGETQRQAAAREVEEEAGVSRLRCLGKLGQRSRLTFTKKKWVTVHYYLFITDDKGGRPTDRHKHVHPARWFSLDRLPHMLWPEQKELLITKRTTILRKVRRAG